MIVESLQGIDINPFHAPKGLLTKTWEETMGERIFFDTGDSSIKSSWGTGGWNITLIDKMKKLYTVPKPGDVDPADYIAQVGKVSPAVAASFVSHVKDPDMKDRPRIDPGNIFKNFFKTVGPIAIVAGIAVIAFSLAPAINNLTLKRG